jgi:hypothetical protein
MTCGGGVAVAERGGARARVSPVEPALGGDWAEGSCRSSFFRVLLQGGGHETPGEQKGGRDTQLDHRQPDADGDHSPSYPTGPSISGSERRASRVACHSGTAFSAGGRTSRSTISSTGSPAPSPGAGRRGPARRRPNGAERIDRVNVTLRGRGCVSSAYVDTAFPAAYADGMEPVRDTAEDAASTDPDVGLRAVAALRALAERLEILQVDSARRAGWSWQQIAERLGVTKQTVHRKHGKRTGGQL